MRGVLIALVRQLAGVTTPDKLASHQDEVFSEVKVILDRIRSVDKDEAVEAEEEIRGWLSFWENYAPPSYGRMGGKVTESTLAYPFGSTRDETYQRQAWPVPTSMRNVDGTSEAVVLNVYDVPEVEED